jgi:hypothetical protein
LPAFWLLQKIKYINQFLMEITMNFKYFKKLLFLLLLGALVFTSSQTLCMDIDTNIEEKETNNNNPVIINDELVDAIRENNLDKVKEIITENPKLVNAKLKNIYEENHWDIPLNLAIYFEKLQITKFLLENGADPDLIDSDEETPLKLAINLESETKLPIIQLLIKYGADPNIIKFTDETLSENNEIESITTTLDLQTAKIFTKMGVDMSEEDLLIPTLELMTIEIEDALHGNREAANHINKRIHFINFIINIGVDLNPDDCFTQYGKHKILILINRTIKLANDFAKKLENF